MMADYLALRTGLHGRWVAEQFEDGCDFSKSHTSGSRILFRGNFCNDTTPEETRATMAKELGFAEQTDLDEAHARIVELEAEVATLKQPVQQRCECKTDSVGVDPVSGPSRPLPDNPNPHNWTWGELTSCLEKARKAGCISGWEIRNTNMCNFTPVCVLLLPEQGSSGASTPGIR
jgi:hypothetical protein